jgi:hypothetical protein
MLAIDAPANVPVYVGAVNDAFTLDVLAEATPPSDCIPISATAPVNV